MLIGLVYAGSGDEGSGFNLRVRLLVVTGCDYGPEVEDLIHRVQRNRPPSEAVDRIPVI